MNEPGQQQVIMMVGNIGTGKTTWIREYLESPPSPEALVIDVDNISTMLAGTGSYKFDVEKSSLYTSIKTYSLRAVLKAGYSVILDGTHINKKSRKRYRDIVRSFPDVQLIVVDFGKGSQESLNRRCIHCRGISSEIWKQVHYLFSKKYQSPRYSEGIDEIFTNM